MFVYYDVYDHFDPNFEAIVGHGALHVSNWDLHDQFGPSESKFMVPPATWDCTNPY